MSASSVSPVPAGPAVTLNDLEARVAASEIAVDGKLLLLEDRRERAKRITQAVSQLGNAVIADLFDLGYMILIDLEVEVTEAEVQTEAFQQRRGDAQRAFLLQVLLSGVIPIEQKERQVETAEAGEGEIQ